MLIDDETGDLTDAFTKVLTSIFNLFDTDQDNHLSLSELQAFAQATNGQLLSANDLQEMKHFETDAMGLTLGGFLDFYHTQTCGDEEETIGDLKKHGYGRDLTKML